jgi:hypothetical protein
VTNLLRLTVPFFHKPLYSPYIGRSDNVCRGRQHKQPISLQDGVFRNLESSCPRQSYTTHFTKRRHSSRREVRINSCQIKHGPCYRSTQIGVCVKRQLLCLIVTKSGMCSEGAAAKRRTVHMPCNRRRGSRDASLECRRDSNEPKNYFCYTAC